MNPHLKIGLFGIGLEAYWEQFEGLNDRLNGYLSVIAEKLSALNEEVVNLGLIDTPAKAFEAGHTFRETDVDIIFLYVATYALSSIALPVVKKVNVPVIILNLSPSAAINYQNFNGIKNGTKRTAEWLAYCSSCTMPELANVFKRSNIPFHQVNGTLHDDPIAWQAIEEWVQAAAVVRIMFHNRLGLMGNYYGGMLDIYSNLTLQCATFGGYMEVIEVDELSDIRQRVKKDEIDEKVNAIISMFDVQPDCEPSELQRAARTAVALDKLILKYNLGSLAYYHKGTGNPLNEDTMSSVIAGSSLLTMQGTPVAGEYEVKNAQAMKILDAFGAGGSFTEYYAIDYTDDIVLMGHDGPGHPAIAEGKIKLCRLQVYHGKNGNGLSVQMSVKHGPVTLLSVVETVDGKVILLIAEGNSVKGPILEIGNTNSRYRFSIGARRFVEEWNAQGPAHHCAIGVGHISSKIKKFGRLLNIDVVQVC